MVVGAGGSMRTAPSHVQATCCHQPCYTSHTPSVAWGASLLPLLLLLLLQRELPLACGARAALPLERRPRRRQGGNVALALVLAQSQPLVQQLAGGGKRGRGERECRPS